MKKTKIINYILIIFVVLLSTELIYLSIKNKELSVKLEAEDNNIVESNNNNNQNEEENNNNENIQNENLSSNDITYTYEQIAEKVYSAQSHYLILWNDGTYEYTNDFHRDETMGTYTIDKNQIYLNYLFAIDSGNDKTSTADDKAIITKGNKIIIINSPSELIDQDTGVKLISVNQPAREDGRSFYTDLKVLLK